MAKGAQKRPARRNPRGNPGGSQEEGQYRAEEEGQLESGSSLFDNMGEDDYILVKRRDDASMKLVTHGKVAPHEATEEYLQGRWGGGEFMLQERKRDASGSYVYGRTRTVHIAGPYKPITLAAVATPGDAGAVPASGAGTAPPGVSANEALNAALVGQVIELLKATREQRPTIEWGPILASLTTLVTTLITAFVNRPKDDSSTKLVEMMMERFNALAEQVTKVQQSPASPTHNAIADAVGAIKELLEVKDMIEGGGKTADPEAAMFNAIPVLLEKMTGAGAASSGKPPALPPGGRPPVDPNVPLWQRFLLAQKRNLLRSATMGVDPAFAAEVALQYMPQDIVGVVREFLLKPDHAELAMQTIPELRNFEAWVRQFFQEVHTGFFAEEAGEGEEEEEEEEIPQ